MTEGYDSEKTNAAKIPITTTEAEGMKAEEKRQAEAAKSKQPKQPKEPKKVAEKSAKIPEANLDENTQKILDFLRCLDHPATTNEVRDKFGFKMRAPARAAFRKLHALWYGTDCKEGNAHIFRVKGVVYTTPKNAAKFEKDKA